MTALLKYAYPFLHHKKTQLKYNILDQVKQGQSSSKILSYWLTFSMKNQLIPGQVSYET